MTNPCKIILNSAAAAEVSIPRETSKDQLSIKVATISDDGGWGKKVSGQITLEKDSVSLLCLYQSFAKLLKKGDDVSLDIAVPSDINQAYINYVNYKTPSMIGFRKRFLFTLSPNTWAAIGSVLSYWSALGDSFWKENKEISKHDPEYAKVQSLKGKDGRFTWTDTDGEMSIVIYPSSLATQEAIWVYFGKECHLHLDIIGAGVLGEAMIQLTSRGEIDRKEVEDSVEEMAAVFYNSEDDDSEEE